MKIVKNQFGFGDFTSFVFIGIFAVIGGMFIIRIFAASSPTVTVQLSGYVHQNNRGEIDYSGIHGVINVDNATSCKQTGGDLQWVPSSIINGRNSYDSHPLPTKSSYLYTIACQNSAGETTAYERVTVS